MILVVHIIIALTTVIVSVLTVLKPSQGLVNKSRYAIAATTLSGILLGVTSNVSIGHLCASGITVVGFCMAMTMVASKKLSTQKIQS